MNPIMTAISRGLARPTQILPGEYGARFVRRLYDEAARELEPTENRRFHWVRSAVAAAIDAANRGNQKDADT